MIFVDNFNVISSRGPDDDDQYAQDADDGNYDDEDQQQMDDDQQNQWDDDAQQQVLILFRIFRFHIRFQRNFLRNAF